MPLISPHNYEELSAISGNIQGHNLPLPVWHSPLVSQIEVAQTLFGGNVIDDGDAGPAS
jgi:hypothetical protein